ncbi:MAG TPA: conjugal transfer protein [Solirubrobacteraceae bacterium]|nr:conjugal transfer protein [Solirubrobacteraceae bacterium]
MDGARAGRARVTVSAKPLWRIRLGRELPRYLVCGLSLAGLLASARFAIAPPRPAAPARARSAAPPRDLAAEGYAQLFARAYLTWEASDPEAHRRALGPFVGSGMEPDAGLQPPAGGEERVQWTEVVQERVATPGVHVYTVAAQTDGAGLLYLSVSVARAREGGLELAGYPAFVGAPASAPASAGGKLREVGEPALQTVVERALRNYLAASGAELAADLAPGARVSLPAQGLSLEAVQRVDWSPEGGDALSAVVQAQDGRGVRYTLAYELDMTLVAGRWEVAAIQMDPDA